MIRLEGVMGQMGIMNIMSWNVWGLADTIIRALDWKDMGMVRENWVAL